MDRLIRSALWTLPVAFGLFFFTFSVAIANFWLKISLSTFLLAMMGLKLTRGQWSGFFSFRPRSLWMGPLSAFVLYGIFWLGKEFSTALFSFASKEISNVYVSRAELSPALIGALLFLVIGPCEEIYWRGFLQRSITKSLGPKAGLFLTSGIYALVHIFTLNVMLLMAAAVCGLFWGWLYQREKSLIPVILSHSIWDLVIFVLFPLTH